MKVREILDIFEKHNLCYFESNYDIDTDTDITLKNDSLEEIIKFCKTTNNNTIFYNIEEVALSDFIIDEESVIDEIVAIITKELDDCYFNDSPQLSIKDFNKEISAILKEIREHNNTAQKRIALFKEPEALFADIFTIHKGIVVGVRLENELLQEIDFALFTENKIKANITEKIEIKLSNNNCSPKKYLSFHDRMIREQNEKRKKIEKILEEIRAFIENDDSLLECTNQTSRHAYSKKLADEYSQKNNEQITISSVEAIANEIYKRKK